ncbi:hypothetical protein GF324_09340 [bacterium]|nr:hypothetical protein [bacterium]
MSLIGSRQHPSSSWSSSVVYALLLHALLIAALVLNPLSAPFDRDPRTEVRMVRIAGGGQNKPGFVRPTTAPPDNAPISTGRPKPQPARRESPPEPAAKPSTQPRMTEPTQTTTDKRAEPSSQGTAQNPTETKRSSAPTRGETGEGVGTKPGPEGPGIGARSDAEFPGADTYLSQIEAKVQNRFNFRGRGTGVVAEYHFYIERNGRIADLVLMNSSGIASLDLAARSAILRSKFPPLPPGYQHDRLGVTYLFYDKE